MSLDVSLYIEVDTGSKEPHWLELHDANYTHNVTPMWAEAGVYEMLYGYDEWERPRVALASEMIPVLEEGRRRMEAEPLKYIAMNPPNGWGDYGTALEFLRGLLRACKEHPKARYDYSA